jgi:nucleoside phosphorylase
MATEELETKTHDDYTVGWICALSKEQTAATAMLDKRHGDLPNPPHDSNTYTLGSIGKHNIVIACLPEGRYGTNAAANVVTLLAGTFPSVRTCLMVGIGGGIPSNKVRLGDVVVGRPEGQFPGVVQWDMGKEKQDGEFERTGTLDNPPKALLTALAKLKTDNELSGSKIPLYLDALKKRYPKAAERYLRSDSLVDICFKASYDHVTPVQSGRNSKRNNGDDDDEEEEGDEDEEDEEDNCQFCDKSKEVKRNPRDMQVHYGLIASGNQVIKDAKSRNKLNKDLGGNVLCIEMEAAGIVNNFPCLVIRGICDYSDSHKNKAWQEHAAAVAAAYAKELLLIVQPNEVQGDSLIKDVLNES